MGGVSCILVNLLNIVGKAVQNMTYCGLIVQQWQFRTLPIANGIN